jgi:hypothetical protein
MILKLLALGGPSSGKLIDAAESNDYAVQVVVHGEKRQLVYLHRSVRWCPPNPEQIIREFITPAGCWATTDWDLEVIVHHWFIENDTERYKYARFMQTPANRRFGQG